MTKFVSTLFLMVCFSLPLVGQEDKPPIPKPSPVKPNSVPGLDLPASFTVNYDEGFTTIQATCDGPVEWLVLLTPVNVGSKAKIKYKPGTDPKSLDISVPPEACTITVFCYGIAKEKLTKPARCVITVDGPVTPAPNPKPGPDPVPNEPLILTLVYDPLANTNKDNEIITKWVDASKKLAALNHVPYLKSLRDPKIGQWLDDASKKKPEFAAAVKAAGIPSIIIQEKSSGKALGVISAPKTLDALLKILSGGK